MKIAQHSDGFHLQFFCEACNRVHTINREWGFNSDFEKPTLDHSVGVRKESDKFFCHSNIRDGRITFHADSTGHNKRGEFELPDHNEFV